jgi:hypothetical protein
MKSRKNASTNGGDASRVGFFSSLETAPEKRCSFYFVEAQHSVKHLKFRI